ncbi:MAG: ATP-binding cassette domain-containing protein [Propionibacteriaceae bacterium]|nr:ATP-binding cassette domain-containing protein [Propionibacteriaceae bacterium]
MDVLFDLAGVRRVVSSGSRETVALVDATCQISVGTFTAVVGASGSGKTTLLSILGLLDRPTAGRYLFDGRDVGVLDETARDQLRGEQIGFVFQNSFLVAGESVADNVALGLRVRGVDSSQRAELVDDALQRVGLAGFQSRVAGDLSGGEKQRVAIARALVGRPSVILADEPTGALDSSTSGRLIQLLCDIAHTGTTVVVVTHDPVVAAAADQRIEIVDGVTKTVAAVSTRQLLSASMSRLKTRRAVRLRQEIIDAMIAPLSRPLRSGLVWLAYLLGVAALVGAIGLTQSATGQIVNRLTDAASNQMRVNSHAIDDPFLIDPVSPDAAPAIVAKLEGVTLAVPVRVFAAQGNVFARAWLPQPANAMSNQTGVLQYSGRVWITEASLLDAMGLQAASGRIDLLSTAWDGAGVVMGAAAAQKLGVAADGPGVNLFVNGRPVSVVAVCKQSGDVLADDGLYFSRGALPFLANDTDSYMFVQTGKGFAEPLAKAIPLALSPQNPGAYQVSTVSQLAGLQQGISSDLAGLLGVVGWVVLVLSALTAGTAMFLSVQHRAPEIALRRAMGASRTSIWRLFIYEGVSIGLAGGIVGQLVGIVLVWALAWRNNWPVSLGLGVGLLGLAVGLTAGVVASTIPAIYAARREPATILRTV